jgi:hypothetical protein
MDSLTPEQLDLLAAAWERAMTPAAMAAHMDREWRRIRRQLPRRVRFRRWRESMLDKAGIWLCDHKLPGCAIALWRVFRMWR